MPSLPVQRINEGKVLRTEKRKQILLALIALLMLLFIWGQSALPVKDSAAESGWLRENVINPLLRLIGLGPVSDHLVRKAAHVGEFFLLSLFAALFLGRKAPLALPLCFAAAFLDESIQLLSDRGAQVKDVWIDLIGVTLGTMLGWIITRNKN